MPTTVELLVGLVRGERRFLELGVHLIEELLRLLRVPLHVPLVGVLRRHDLLEGLLREPLGRREVRVLPGADVLRRLLGERVFFIGPSPSDLAIPQSRLRLSPNELAGRRFRQGVERRLQTRPLGRTGPAALGS